SVGPPDRGVVQRAELERIGGHRSPAVQQVIFSGSLEQQSLKKRDNAKVQRRELVTGGTPGHVLRLQWRRVLARRSEPGGDIKHALGEAAERIAQVLIERRINRI